MGDEVKQMGDDIDADVRQELASIDGFWAKVKRGFDLYTFTGKSKVAAVIAALRAIKAAL